MKSPKNSSNAINIGLVTDDKYAPYAGVVIYSLLRNCSVPHNVHIYIMDRGISQVNKNHITKISSDFKSKVTYLNSNLNLKNELKSCRHFGIETYYKLALFDSCPCEKLLYLDCDLVVLGDVARIYHSKISPHSILAVKDLWISVKKRSSLGIPKGSWYFNAGVLLIDSKSWRKNNFTNKIINYLKNNPSRIDFGDQDGLNAILKDEWGNLDYSWNVLARTGFYKMFPFAFPKHSEDEHEYGVNKSPNIIHFAGLFKPWFIIDPITFKSIFRSYISLTPWKNYSRQDNSFIPFINRLLNYSKYIKSSFTYFIKYF